VNPIPNQYQHVDKRKGPEMHAISANNFLETYQEEPPQPTAGAKSPGTVEVSNMMRNCQMNESEMYLSIQTWDDCGIIRIGIAFDTDGERQHEPVGLSRDEVRDVLTLEEECSQ
jgi:hypothetical protein